MARITVNMPRLDIHTWRLASASGHAITLRPSLRTLFWRLAITAVIAMIVAPIGYSIGNYRAAPVNVASEEEERRLRDMTREMERDIVEEGILTQEEVDAINAETEQRLAESRQEPARFVALDRIMNVGETVFWVLAGLMGFAALLAPVSLLWQRVDIRLDMHDRLVIYKRGILAWLSTRRMDMTGISSIGIRVQEREGWVEYGGRRSEGFFWHVTLYSTGGSDRGELAPPDYTEFIVHRQKDRPWEEEQLPAPVERFVRALEVLTGLPADRRFAVSDASARRSRGLFSPTRTVTRSEPHVSASHTVYNSLDEMPPDIRAMAEQMMEDARHTGQPVHVEESMVSQTTQSYVGGRSTQQSQSITYRDANGQTHTFNSIDEMPPAIRAKYEAFLKRKT